jgi:hypothetical protein
MRAAFLFAVMMCATGLAGTQSNVGRPLRAGDFERVIAPFPVFDADGRQHALPFLGGLDVPRPQFVDIDADGDLDLFLQEYSNALWFFENTGSAKTPIYTWRTDRYQDLEIGEWFRFVDLDADGDVDLLSEQALSHIRIYRNAGSRQAARFEAAGALKDTDGADIFIDRQNIPAIVDLDCDKRLDLFVGRVEGTVARYEAEQPGGERFAFITERFENIEILGRIGDSDVGRAFSPGLGVPDVGRAFRPGGPSFFHGANALAFADFDGDRDLDLFWGDFFEPGVLLIENIGRTCSTPSFDVDPIVLPGAASIQSSGYNAPVPVDVDLDGDLDFLMGVIGGAFNPVTTSADNFYFWERVAGDRFELRTKRLLDGIDLGTETVPAVADLDADGDLDLVVGNKIDPARNDFARLAVYTNEGTKTSPRFRLTGALPLAEAYHFAPALGDLDADGDPDLLVGTWNSDILYFRNSGTPKQPKWTLDEKATIRPPRMSLTTPVLVDIDEDKDLDLFIGQATGAVAFYRNDGTPKTPRFVLVSEQLEGVRAGRRSRPAVVDLDGDGRLDLVVGRESTGVVAYRNAGTGREPKFVEYPAFTLPLPPMSSPVFADLDGDGVLEVVLGTVSGGVVLYRGTRQR